MVMIVIFIHISGLKMEIPFYGDFTRFSRPGVAILRHTSHFLTSLNIKDYSDLRKTIEDVCRYNGVCVLDAVCNLLKVEGYRSPFVSFFTIKLQ